MIEIVSVATWFTRELIPIHHLEDRQGPSLRSSTLIKAMLIKPKSGQWSKPQTTGRRSSRSTEPSKSTVHRGAVRYSIAMIPSKWRWMPLSAHPAATNPTKSQRKLAKSGVFQTLGMNGRELRCPRANFATVLEMAQAIASRA